MLVLPAEQRQRLLTTMGSLFGEPEWLVAAPGRVNMIGEHVDYNDGFVLPFAIDRYTAIAARPACDATMGKVRVYSLETETLHEIQVHERPCPAPGRWSNYVAGVIAGHMDRGMRIPSFDAVIHSRIPAGSGLSSSAALTVATSLLLEQMTGESLDWESRALLCQRAEHQFAGVPCGLMDQIASICGRAGKAMLIDCAENAVEWVPFSFSGIRMFLVNSLVRHDLAETHYASRRKECQQILELAGKASFRQVTPEDLDVIRSRGEEKLFRRGRHVLTETARVQRAAVALRTGDYTRLAGLMSESQASMRDDFEISCPEIDALVEASQGVSGPLPVASRMTGGGFGGCTINLVPDSSVLDFLRAIRLVRCKSREILPEVFEISFSTGASTMTMP